MPDPQGPVLLEQDGHSQTIVLYNPLSHTRTQLVAAQLPAAPRPGRCFV